jgi:hypothetical protein
MDGSVEDKEIVSLAERWEQKKKAPAFAPPAFLQMI